MEPFRALMSVMWMSASPAPVSPSSAPAVDSIWITGRFALCGAAEVTFFPHPSIRRSLPPEPVEAPIITFSIVLAYIAITSLSAAAMTASWSVLWRRSGGR